MDAGSRGENELRLSMENTTALLVFVKYPEPGKVKTRLAEAIGEERAADCHARMASLSVKRFRTAPETDCIVYFAPEKEETYFRHWFGGGLGYLPQPDGNLGARLSLGFQNVLARGYQRVIALGTDSPDVPVDYISQADLALQAADVAVGPAADGGYYLIGLSQSHPALFEDIDWSTTRVLGQTLDRAREAGLSVRLLPEWHDVDSIGGLTRLADSDDPEIAALAAEYAVRRRIPPEM